MTLRTRRLLVRVRVIVAREARRWRQELRRDLSAYDTQRDRDDLLAALDRHPDERTHELREILARRPVPGPRPGQDRWPAMGRF